MSAGIEVYNDDGKLVIDENYKNLCMTRKILIETLPLIRPGSGYRGYVLKLEKMSNYLRLSFAEGNT